MRQLFKDIHSVIVFRLDDGISFVFFGELFVGSMALFCALLTMFANHVYFGEIPFPFWTFFLYLFILMQIIPIWAIIGITLREVRYVRMNRKIRNLTVQP